MTVVDSGSAESRYLKRLPRSRYMAARPTAYHAKTADSDPYILDSAKNNAPAFRKGNSMSVVDVPLTTFDLSWGVTTGIKAKITPNAIAKATVVGRCDCE